MTKTMEKWLGFHFSTGSYPGDDYKSFERNAKADLIFGDMEQVIIKQQHNCICDASKYAGKFIPLEHEYLVIIKKNDPYIIPVTHVQFFKKDMRESTKSTWAAVIAMILEAHGGRMSKDELVATLEKHPKASNNNNVYAKLRQELQYHSRMFSRGGDTIKLAACA